MGETILTMTGIEKTFPGVHALKNCQFELKSGEVHALVGENGAGKSTLMKILTGVHKKDGGKIVFMNEELSHLSPKEAQEKGISMIHQELNLMPHLSCAQNIFIGREPKRGGIFTDDKKLNRDAFELFSRLGLSLDPKTLVGNITVAGQQMVEIAKALSFQSKILIMDEPTAALTDKEIEDLFHIIADLKTQGVGIIYISHRMDELMKITDRISVMRDGEYIKTVMTKDTDTDEIIQMMVGRPIYEPPKNEISASKGEVVLSVENLCTDRLSDISFSLHRGEILGFAGLMGAGRTEVARAVFGADLSNAGTIKIHGKPVNIRSPKDAVACGIGYLSEDRKQYGLCLGMSVEDNTVLASLSSFSRAGFIRQRETARVTKDYISQLKTKTPSINQDVRNLSGGNQQKVIIAKWLLKDCDVLIFDEPTRGIDIGAKSEIYKLLDDLAKSGKAIIMISSELPEILRMSDRVAVMCEGRITKILDSSDCNQETIMKYATNHNQKGEMTRE